MELNHNPKSFNGFDITVQDQVSSCSIPFHLAKATAVTSLEWVLMIEVIELG